MKHPAQARRAIRASGKNPQEQCESRPQISYVPQSASLEALSCEHNGGFSAAGGDSGGATDRSGGISATDLSVCSLGQVQIATAPSIVLGQDLSVSLHFVAGVVRQLRSSVVEKQQELLQELNDIDIGVGTLQATNQRSFEAVHPAVNQLRDWVAATLSM